MREAAPEFAVAIDYAINRAQYESFLAQAVHQPNRTLFVRHRKVDAGNLESGKRANRVV